MQKKEYIVVIKNGTVSQPTTEKEFKEFEEFKAKDDLKGLFAKYGQDVYISKNEKDSLEFMGYSSDIKKAQVFTTQVQAKAIIDFLVEVNKINGKTFEMYVAELKITAKEVK